MKHIVYLPVIAMLFLGVWVAYVLHHEPSPANAQAHAELTDCEKQYLRIYTDQDDPLRNGKAVVITAGNVSDAEAACKRIAVRAEQNAAMAAPTPTSGGVASQARQAGTP